MNKPSVYFMMLCLIAGVLASALFLAVVAFAQTDELDSFTQSPEEFVEETDAVEGISVPVEDPYLKSDLEVTKKQINSKLVLVLIICITAISVLSITLKHFKESEQATPDHMLNISALVLIIFGTILLVVIADFDQQLAPAIGIFGAVAGYVFGRMSFKEGPHGSNVPPPNANAPVVPPKGPPAGP